MRDGIYLFKKPRSPHWYTEFVISGRRVRRSTGTASRRDAENIARRLRDEARAEAARPAPSKPASLTVSQACGRYWIEHGRELRAARDEQRHLQLIVKHIDETMLLSELSNRHINELVANRRAEGVAPATINRTVECLKRLHNRAGKLWEEPVRVIAWSTHRQKEPKERIRWLRHEQATRLLELLDGFAPHIASLVRFMVLSGLRKREAFQATWDKLDLEHRILHAQVKGGHYREVPLSEEACLLLRTLPQDGAYIFDTTNARKHYDRALAEAGITNFTWHDLRHTFACWMAMAGAPIEVISRALGHSSIAVTMKYRHVVHDEVREALKSFPSLRRPEVDNVVVIAAESGA